MKVSFTLPGEAAQPYVSTYYLFEDDSRLIDDAQRADCGHLRFLIEGSGTQFLPIGKRAAMTPVMLTGPHSKASRFRLNGPFRFMGCSLRARAWGGLVAQTAEHMSESGGDALLFLRSPPDTLLQALKTCATLEQMVPFLDAYLTQQIRPLPAEHEAIIEAIRAWLFADAFPKVEALYAQCALGERQVTRISNRYWGAPPKSLARTYSALRTASKILTSGGIIPDDAIGHYADRPHLIREVKRVTGMTPRHLGTINDKILQLTLGANFFRELMPLT
jgi:AraC-like DNA-binding protein